MAKVLVYTTHGKPFRVPVPGGGLLVFGPTPQEFDLSEAELAAVEDRRKKVKALQVTPLSRRAAEQIGELAGEVDAARERMHELEAELGARIVALEAELDQAHENAHTERQRFNLDIAELEEQTRAAEQREVELRAQLDEARGRVAELEESGRELERARKDLDEARAKITRLEAQQKKR